jgi:small subunit ribosomal protein S17
VTDEENNETTEEETPAPEETPAEETPAPEETPAEEAPTPEEAPAEEAPAEETPAPEAPEADEPAAEPVAVVHPKEKRKRERSLHTGEARPQQTPEERQAARREERAKKAKARSAYRPKGRAKAKARRAATPPIEAPPVHAETTGQPKVRQGIVISSKADKTITVKIDQVRRHRRYEKVIRRTAALHVHDEANDANEGDTVRVIESRPLSRTKRWRLVEVLERAK